MGDPLGGPLEKKERKPFVYKGFRFVVAERTRFELAVELPLRQFSKLLVSATHPPLRKLAESIFNSDCKGTAFFDTCKSFARFFLKKHFKAQLSRCEFECCEYVPDNEKRGRRTALLPRVYTVKRILVLDDDVVLLARVPIAG